MPNPGLAGYAIEVTGTKEQKLKFLQRFTEGDTPVWGGMAMTEPGAGSDTSAIQTRNGSISHINTRGLLAKVSTYRSQNVLSGFQRHLNSIFPASTVILR
jgi:hypothetical protein